MCRIFNSSRSEEFTRLPSDKGAIQQSQVNGRSYCHFKCKSNTTVRSLFKGLSAVAIGSGCSYGIARLMINSDKSLDVMLPGILGEFLTLGMTIIGLAVVINTCCPSKCCNRKPNILILEELTVQ